MTYSAKLWLRLDAEQMKMIDQFRASCKRRTITVAIRHLIQKGLESVAARTARKELVGALCVHLKRDTFLHVAVFKKLASADAALFPLSPGMTRNRSVAHSSALPADGDAPNARIGNAS
jgi:hypothetical protein